MYKSGAAWYNLCMEYTLISGATGVIGRTFALACLKRGENLFLTGRSEQKLSILKDYLLTINSTAEIKTFACDLSHSDGRKKLFEAVEGLIFCRLVNVAGADTQKAFCLYDEDKLTFQTGINFEAAASLCLFCIKHAAKRLKIINISSVCGEMPMPYFALYGAAKGALTAFSVALSEECRGTGITVTAVLPGAVYTRPDVCEYIKKQGFWGRIAAKSPQFVVEKSLKASDRGKRKVVVGAANKIALALSKTVPAAVKLKMNGKMRKDVSKDAF